VTGEGPPRTGGGRLLVVISGLFLLLAVLGAWAVHVREVSGREKSALLRDIVSDIQAEVRALEDEDPMPPDGENAAVLYAKASPLVAIREWHLLQRTRVPWDRVPEDLRTLVEAHSAALALVERAAGMERCRFPTDYEVGSTSFAASPHAPPAQASLSYTFGHLLVARARIAQQEGRTREAVRDAVLVARMARHRIRRSLEALGEADWMVDVPVRILEEALHRPDLDAATARSVARVLLEWKDFRECAPWNARFKALNEEGRAWTLVADRCTEEYAERLRKEFGLAETGLFRSFSADDIAALQKAREGWEGVRARARSGEPYPAAPGPFTGKLTVLRAAFAVRAHQLEKGAPPARLEDLVPDLLPAVPQDPWGSGPLRYEVRGDAWSVESVGKVNGPKWVPSRGYEWVPVDLRIEWPPKAEPPR